MQTRALGVAVVLFGATCCVPAAKGIPTPETLAPLLEAESVTLYSADEERPYCSGVWVRKAFFVTAAHCMGENEVGDAISYVVPRDVVESTNDVQIAAVRNATVRFVDEDHDLALVAAIDPPEHGIAKLAAKMPVPGARVFAMGSPLGLYWSFSAGDVAAIRRVPNFEKPIRYVQATAAVSPGSSGCGLFDVDGNLVGIARGIAGANGVSELLNLFIGRDDVADFLDGVQRDS